MRATIVAAAVALALAVLTAGGAGATTAGSCPAAWTNGWQRLADRIHAPVYCPTWMPNPLDAKIGGDYTDIYSVSRDRSYLVSFLEHGDAGRAGAPPRATLSGGPRPRPPARGGRLRARRPAAAGAAATRRGTIRPVARAARLRPRHGP